jgi:solute carrier family 25 carnitine/acylcarnitine transporter 20/29
LTKLSAQISVLMAERNDGGGKNDAIRKSYQNLGTLRTAQNLIKHRGWRGLYSGFHLHLRTCPTKIKIERLIHRSSRLHRHRHLLRYLRECEANTSKRPRHVIHTPPCRRSSGRPLWPCELGLRKSLSSTLYTPHTNRLQIFPIDTAKSIYQRNCLVGGRDKATRPKIQFLNPRMYRGLGVSMSRSCVVNAIFFTAFEAMKKRVNYMSVDEELLHANGL